MGTIVKRFGVKGVTFRAVVRKKGVFKTKSFPTRALAKKWITSLEAQIDERAANSTLSSARPEVPCGDLPQGNQSHDDGESTPAAASRPWLTLGEAAALTGLTPSSARNLRHLERFPVPSEKLGRRVIVMKDVLAEYFRIMTERGVREVRERYSGK